MLKIALRAAMTFAFSIFGRKVIALVALVLLLFAATVLYDLKMYVSAGLAGVLSVVALIAFGIQYRRQVIANRLRATRQAEAAQRRAAAVEARTEKMDRAKATVKDTVKGMTTGAADVAKTGFAGARDRVQGWRRQPL
jgi:hypothetical protein